MSDDAAEQKRGVRADVRSARAARTPTADTIARVRFANRLWELVEELGATSVAAYVGVTGEPDPGGFVAQAADRGVRVHLPVIGPDRTLSWVPAGGGFRPGPYGIPEPIGDPVPAAAVADWDLLIVPACAVSGDGTRLGWGGGYYDRVLADRSPAQRVFALVHDAEVFATLPRETHDIPVDGAVTPERILRFPSDSPVSPRLS